MKRGKDLKIPTLTDEFKSAGEAEGGGIRGDYSNNMPMHRNAFCNVEGILVCTYSGRRGLVWGVSSVGESRKRVEVRRRTTAFWEANIY